MASSEERAILNVLTDIAKELKQLNREIRELRRDLQLRKG